MRVTQSTDQKIMAETLTTKADHNGTGHGPIPADAGEALSQVSDRSRQSGRILQAGDQDQQSYGY